MIAGLVLLIAVAAIPVVLQGVMNLLARMERRSERRYEHRYQQRHA